MMSAKEFHRIEMAVIMAERQAYQEQGLEPQAPSLEQAWYRFPSMVAELQQLEELVAMCKAHPELIDVLNAQAAQAQQQAMAA